ncbi:hypothetical protein EIM48_14830 [Pseudoxanthomonas sp. SGNA-20]|uniref:LPP20 lipoprotein n=1 Tax=Pseudoxanthomonas taiwanensis J19 TaxID=935569 RepID=A0A562D394_9GAMM|nr:MULTISPECIES: hypothetical protein [Pseudoxanthomonas]RRN53765.1 hypothetical protein EIM48_14830 [Pseudoxanthomonas sp. SGNA-20]RRN79568.1 hypothetical protein EIM50_10000 [Pseudoxanthomonas sp. SGD-10]TWH04205.1 hypothetical protein L613_007300000110 [Pseudoxanthomonas taiwanensis J19]
MQRSRLARSTLRARLRLLLPAMLLLLAACRPDPGAPAELPGAASEPAGAVRQLAGHLQRNDLVAFARDALPPQTHAALAAAWREDRSRWPLTELPLDDQLPSLLATLAEPGAEADLRRRFDRQLAGQDTALRDAARSLSLFGVQYLRQQAHYSDEERAHYVQTVEALGAWAGQAPLGDPRLGHAAIERLAAAARQTGLASEEDLRQAGMEDSLRRLGPFLAAVKATTADYGLDLDHSLTDLRTGLVEERGDHATVRLHYPLAGREIDTTLRLTRLGGHWYLDGYLEEAARVLAAATPAEALPEPPEAAADPGGR